MINYEHISQYLKATFKIVASTLDSVSFPKTMPWEELAWIQSQAVWLLSSLCFHSWVSTLFWIILPPMFNFHSSSNGHPKSSLLPPSPSVGNPYETWTRRGGLCYSLAMKQMAPHSHSTSAKGGEQPTMFWGELKGMKRRGWTGAIITILSSLSIHL